MIPSSRCRAEKHGAERNKNQKADVCESDSRRNAKARKHITPGLHAECSFPWLIDPVEDSLVIKMFFLRLLPSAEIRDRHHGYRRELSCILVGHRLESGAIVILRGDFLGFGSIEVIQISLRHGCRSVFLRNL